MPNTIGGVVTWNLDVDSSKFDEGLNSAKRKIEATTKDIQSSVKSMSDNMVESFKTGGLAATGFIASVGLLGKSMISVAADFEQNRISFETMTGSAEKGRKFLAELSNFAAATPFELPQLLVASKSLLAYGIESENLIPTLKNLGDIASGVGMDKLPQLVLAFGQVKAATKLTGAELRQFSEAGVPLLQALVDQANKTGGVLTKVGGVSKQTGTKIKGLASSIASTEVEMKFFKETGGKTDKQLKAMQKTIDLNKYKLAQFGTVGQDVYKKVKVTAEQMKDSISDGNVKFEDVQKALAGMSGEGGKFFNLMEKQSHTFGGVMSNIKDQITRSLAEIAGIDIQAGGIIREGSIFAVMKQGAELALSALNKFTPILVNFTQKLIANKDAMKLIAGAFGGAIILAVGAFIVTFGAGIAILATFMAVGAGVTYVVDQIAKSFGGWQNIINTLTPAFNFLGGIFSGIILPQLQSLWNTISFQLLPALQDLWNTISPILIPTLKFLAIVLGVLLIGAISAFISFIKLIVLVITDFVNTTNVSIQNVIIYFQTLVDGLKAVWGLISEELGSWSQRFFDWGITLMNSFADGIKSAAKAIIDAVKNTLNQAKRLLEGHSPPIAGPFKDIDTWGFNVGKAWIGGVQSAIGGLSLQNPMMASSPAFASTSSGMSGGKRSININIDTMNVRDKNDAENIAKEIGFRVEMSPGYNDNG